MKFYSLLEDAGWDGASQTGETGKKTSAPPNRGTEMLKGMAPCFRALGIHGKGKMIFLGGSKSAGGQVPAPCSVTEHSLYPDTPLKQISRKKSSTWRAYPVTALLPLQELLIAHGAHAVGPGTAIEPAARGTQQRHLCLVRLLSHPRSSQAPSYNQESKINPGQL